MTQVKVGQVWKDKDKRRNTVIEIISIAPDNMSAKGLVVGTEDEREYAKSRLVKRWELVKEKAEKPKPAKKTRFKTREQWLTEAVELLRKKVFAPKNIEVPNVRVSVGWPGGRGKKTGVIGQCFPTASATDKQAQIFISPVVSSGLAVVITLAHELVHAADDCKSGHKGSFVKIAREIGFMPKWTVATEDVVTDELKAICEEISDKLGEYPHAALTGQQKRPEVQKTYMLKVLCPEDPDYFVRMTQTKLDEYGAPLCPCHKKPLVFTEGH